MVYINGEYFAKGQAKVSVFDRGFLYSDGVYEVIPWTSNKFLFFEEHIQRLARSCKEVEIALPSLDYLEIGKKVMEQEQISDGFLYLQITRGAKLERSHTWKENEYQPTVVAFGQKVQFAPRLSEFAKITDVPKETLAKLSLKASTTEDIRWGRCDIKSVALLPNVLLRHQSAQKGYDETIFTKNSCVTEGTSTNVFMVKKGVVYTPSLKENILPGVTRTMLIKALRKAKVKCVEGPIKTKAFLNADEVWLTSSTKDVLPVIKLNGKKVGAGKPGEIWFKAYKLFQNIK